MKKLCIVSLIFVFWNYCLVFGQEVNGLEMLKQLKSFDSVYEAAFTATGTRLFASPVRREIPPQEKKWKISMSDGKIAYEEDVIEILKWEDVTWANNKQGKEVRISLRGGKETMPAIVLRSTYLFGPTMQAKYDFVGKIPPVGKLPPWPEGSPGLATAGSLDFDDPDAPTYNFEIKRTLWTLGRGYSKHIADITKIEKQKDGLIFVIAEGTDISYRQGAKWELLIDPDAAYMVRSAKLFKMGNEKPIISIVNSGIKWEGSRCIPNESTWRDNYLGGNIATSEFKAVSSEADVKFIRHAEMTMKSPYLLHTDVTDHRMNPEMMMQYNAGKLFPKGKRKGDEDFDLSVLTDPQAFTSQKQDPPQNGKSQVVSAKDTKSSVRDSEPFSKSERNNQSFPLARNTINKFDIKRVAACFILFLSLTVGICYFCFRMRRRKS